MPPWLLVFPAFVCFVLAWGATELMISRFTDQEFGQAGAALAGAALAILSFFICIYGSIFFNV